MVLPYVGMVEISADFNLAIEGIPPNFPAVQYNV